MPQQSWRLGQYKDKDSRCSVSFILWRNSNFPRPTFRQNMQKYANIFKGVWFLVSFYLNLLAFVTFKGQCPYSCQCPCPCPCPWPVGHVWCPRLWPCPCPYLCHEQDMNMNINMFVIMIMNMDTDRDTDTDTEEHRTGKRTGTGTQHW
jgi:hypothetical protein